jgi:hypothetical protein
MAGRFASDVGSRKAACAARRRRRSALTASLCILLCLLAACAKSREQWERELDDPDPFASYLAAIALAKESRPLPPKAFNVLLESAHSEDPRVQRTAQRAIARRPQEAAQAYVNDLSTQLAAPTRDLSSPISALRALGDFAAEPLAAQIVAPRLAQRAELWELLGELGPNGRAAAGKLLEHEDVRIRLGAAHALERAGPDALEEIPALWRALADREPAVALAAARALQAMEPSETELRKALGCDPPTSPACVQVLSTLEEPLSRASPVLREKMLQLLALVRSEPAERSR